MKNNYQEPEETTSIQDAETIPDSDMLTSEPIIDRSHAAAGTGGATVNEWTPPPLSADFNTDEDAEQAEQEQARPAHDHEFANDELVDLPENEKLEGAMHLARGIFQAADVAVTDLGNMVLPLKQKRLNKLQNAGEINLNILLNYGGTPISAQAAIDDFNDKATDALSLSQEYIDAGVPIIAKELAKKGIGLTPMQQFLFILTPLEIKRMAGIAWKIRSTGNEIIDALKANTAAYNGYQAPMAGPGSAPAPQAAAPAPPPAAAPAEYQQPTEFQQPPADVIVMDAAGMRENAIANEFDRIQQNNLGQGGIITDIPGMPSQNNRRPRNSSGRKRKAAKKK